MPVGALSFRESEEEGLLYRVPSMANLQFGSDGGGHGSRTAATGCAIDAGPGIGTAVALRAVIFYWCGPFRGCHRLGPDGMMRLARGWARGSGRGCGPATG